MNNREAHYYLEELQRMMTQYRGIFTEEFVCANGMAILALEQERKTGRWLIKPHKMMGDTPCCSECGAFEPIKSRFCPNCGCVMKGEDDEVHSDI